MPETIVLSSIPERFFQIQDDSGFLWQALDNGALISGESQYLQSGMNLVVDGEPFAPASGSVREPGSEDARAEVKLQEARDGLVVDRDLWFDPRRSGVRILDRISNTGSSARTFEVVLRTTYPFAWQSLHGSGGRMLSGEPAPQLGADDGSLSVRFSASDGRHDTYLLFGAAGGGVRPVLKTSSNSREMVFAYELEVPAGESRALLHWILQRNLPEVGDAGAVFAPFLQRGQLILPGVEPTVGAIVENFPRTAFPVESGVPSRLRSLVALNEFAERVGSQRRSEDLLWQGPTAQTGGSLSREGIYAVEAVGVGRIEFPISELAALRGGAGQGITPLFFLRDGRVLAGLSWTGSLSWSSGSDALASSQTLLEPEELHMLLLATASQDGIPPARSSHFVQLSWGSVVAVDMGEGGESEVAKGGSDAEGSPQSNFVAVSSLGPIKAGWEEVVELERFQRPAPSWRVLLADGSLLVAMLSPEETRFLTVTGPQIAVPGGAVERVWRAGETPRLRESKTEDWLDLSEVPDGLGPAQGFLLAGNQLLAGRFDDDELVVLDGDAPVRVETGRIRAMRRSDGPGARGFVEFELEGNDKISGVLLAPYLRIASRGSAIEVPAGEVLGYRSEKAER